MPVDVLEVTAGQDRGARFELLGSEATIGRGPVMDMVLTDPRVSRRHARLRVAGQALLVEDLGSTGGTRVNGARISGPTAIARGDRVALGGTEMTVLWTPGHPEPPSPPPPPAPPPPPPAPEAPRAAGGGLLPPVLALAFAAFSLGALWLPVISDRRGGHSLWSIGPAGIRAQSLSAVLAAAATAAAWLASALRQAGPALIRALAVATAVAGGLVLGIPLFLGAVHLTGATRAVWLLLLALAGLAIVACGLAGLALEPLLRVPAPAAEPAIVALGGGLGGLIAAAAAPLPWVSSRTLELSGVDAGLAAGRWLVPLVVALVGCSALVPAVARAGHRRPLLALAAGVAALAATVLTFATTGAIGYSGYHIEAGLVVAIAGGCVALATTVFGALSMALRPGS